MLPNYEQYAPKRVHANDNWFILVPLSLESYRETKQNYLKANHGIETTQTSEIYFLKSYFFAVRLPGWHLCALGDFVRINAAKRVQSHLCEKNRLMGTGATQVPTGAKNRCHARVSLVVRN